MDILPISDKKLYEWYKLKKYLILGDYPIHILRLLKGKGYLHADHFKVFDEYLKKDCNLLIKKYIISNFYGSNGHISLLEIIVERNFHKITNELKLLVLKYVTKLSPLYLQTMPIQYITYFYTGNIYSCTFFRKRNWFDIGEYNIDLSTLFFVEKYIDIDINAVSSLLMYQIKTIIKIINQKRQKDTFICDDLLLFNQNAKIALEYDLTFKFYKGISPDIGMVSKSELKLENFITDAYLEITKWDNKFGLNLYHFAIQNLLFGNFDEAKKWKMKLYHKKMSSCPEINFNIQK